MKINRSDSTERRKDLLQELSPLKNGTLVVGKDEAGGLHRYIIEEYIASGGSGILNITDNSI